MTLREVLERIDTFAPEASVYMANTSDLDAIAFVHETGDDDPPERVDGMPLVMDVWQVRETVDGLRSLLREQSGADPSQGDLFDRFLDYLANNA